MKRPSFLKHIYKVGKKWQVRKYLKGKDTFFKAFDDINDAMEYRDRLIENNWKPLPETPEERYEREWKEYYYAILRDVHGTRYRVQDNYTYYGMVKTIEEALYYRDMVLDGERRKPKELDLKTDNPYLDGLKFPLPERLILPEKKKKYGKGSIVKKGECSYHVHHGGHIKGKTYVCACPTPEMAEYVRAEMNKCDWDMTQLDRIIEDYPRYYTKLLFFYIYVQRVKNRDGEWTGRYMVVPPVKYTNGTIEPIYYNCLEDALYERDFLKDHDWNYELLVECIDDNENPYYDMELPPFPTRRKTKVREFSHHEKELTKAVEIIRDGGNQEDVATILNITPVSLRKWLREGWNTTWVEFSRIAKDGENPLEVLEKQEKIYYPDLSRPKPSNFKNYVSRLNTPYGIRYSIQRKGIAYGTYPTRELALKISKDMAKVDWDKSKLEEVQAKHGWQSMMNSRRWVYPNKCSWTIRHKDKNRKMINYGTYRDKRVANLVRDMLIEHDWNKEAYPMLREIAEWTVEMIDKQSSTMFGVWKIEYYEHIETEEKIPHTSRLKNGKLQVEKVVNGYPEYYGNYTEDKAREVVEFLMDNNWDKELLKAMQEMGEI